MKNLFVFSFLLLNLPLFSQVTPLPNAHAHNDYRHQRPLLDALDQGFMSIEVDVFLIKDELYVAHTRPFFRKKKKTLRHLYLEPLKKRIEANQGQVYKGHDEPLFLMIDIKTEEKATYEILKKQLAEYQDYLSKTIDGNFEKGAIQIFLSGNRLVERVLSENKRLMAVDGRPRDLNKNYSAEEMPVISQRFSKVVNWDGIGEIPEMERLKIAWLVVMAHQEGKKLRFWKIPDNENAWQTLLNLGVDLINTDDLEGLKSFLEDKD